MPSRKALWALGLLVLLFVTSVAHHHTASASDSRSSCPACELKQTTPVTPQALIAIAAPPPAEFTPPQPPAAPAPRPLAPLAEAPKTSPPA